MPHAVECHSSDDDDYDVLTHQEPAMSRIESMRRSDEENNEASFFISSPSVEEQRETPEGRSASESWTAEELRVLLSNSLLIQPLPGVSEDDQGDVFETRRSISEVLCTSQEETKEEGRPLIYKRIIWPGYGAQVTPQSTVSFHLVAYAEHQEIPFDSTEMRGKPFLIRLDQDPLLEGVYLSLLSMKAGEKAEFIVPPELAYGKQGAPPRIPANATILFVITVKKIHREGSIGNYLTLTPQEQAALSTEKILQIVDSEKQSGNSYFKSKKYSEAFSRYNRAIRFLCNCSCPEGEEADIVQQVLGTLLTNAGNAALQLAKYDDCIKLCKRALQLNSSNVKAMYLTGKSYFMLEKYDQSKRILERVNQLEPNCSEVIQILVDIAKKERSDEESSKQLAKLMAKAFCQPPRH